LGRELCRAARTEPDHRGADHRDRREATPTAAKPASAPQDEHWPTVWAAHAPTVAPPRCGPGPNQSTTACRPTPPLPTPCERAWRAQTRGCDRAVLRREVLLPKWTVAGGLVPLRAPVGLSAGRRGSLRCEPPASRCLRPRVPRHWRQPHPTAAPPSVADRKAAPTLTPGGPGEDCGAVGDRPRPCQLVGRAGALRP